MYAVVSSECDWSEAKSWAQWWLRPKHLQMLAKPFSQMNENDWDKAPMNTNGVERINSLSKSRTARPAVLAAMQCRTRCFVLQFIAAEGGAKTSYRSNSEQKRREQSSLQKKNQKSISDKTAEFAKVSISWIQEKTILKILHRRS